ncbi:MAG: radical SAM protein [Deltaproteobacteria bacterium]|nr:radical SAM protein [Deltaproteobacteria bacterium]MBW2047165.1 radical SAM protein [Deltaproteobacteria bacterium]MBW2109842.1 radical SAM protein [Deltaproteobacteria bacterium]MBW2352552.1 radical SAM protein [Deltaproteobacteria bacterium]
MSGDIISLYRARLARERGTVIKDPGGRLTIALAYPNYYRLGMSNLGFQIVYGLLNKNPRVVAERAFLPEGQELSLYLRSGKPLLSLETQRPLHKFDLLAFSLSFENDYPNVLQTLDLARIPLLSEERSGPGPLVMAGGVTTFLNPEPLSPFMDFFLLGEAEDGMARFLELFMEISPSTVSKRDALTDLARNMPALYVPSLYRVQYHKDGTLKAFTPKGDGIPEKIGVAHPPEGGFAEKGVPISTVTTPDTEFGNKVLLELGRGCGHSCRFCAAGYVYRPPRSYGNGELNISLEKAVDKSRNIGLLSPAVSDIPGVENLMDAIVQRGGSFSVSSLRAETLTRGLLDRLRSSGQRSITVAPEAGSERLRRTINKHLTESQILEAVRMISGAGDFSLKLYFLMGLPTETDNDIRGIPELVKRIRHQMVRESAKRGTIGRIKLSVNCFVPKAFTPFQWFPMDEVGILKKKQKWLKKSLTKTGGVHVGVDVPRWAYVQTLLSMGDRRTASILLAAHKRGGDWTRAMRFSDMNPDFFVYRPKRVDEMLPWDFIDNGISKEHLIRERDLALKGDESPICSVGQCYRCGVCVREGAASAARSS